MTRLEVATIIDFNEAEAEANVYTQTRLCAASWRRWPARGRRK